MKKYVFTKTFNSEEELNSFVNTNVGEDKYWKIREQWVTITGLTITIAMKSSRNFWNRKQICDNNGFVMERKDV